MVRYVKKASRPPSTGSTPPSPPPPLHLHPPPHPPHHHVALHCSFFAHNTNRDNIYYTVHGDDAKAIAANFYKTSAVLRTSGGVPVVSLSATFQATVLRDLLIDSTTPRAVEIYEGSGPTWRLSKSASPGRVTDLEDDPHFESHPSEDTPVVAALHLVQLDGVATLGLAFCDPAARSLGACEFVDDDRFCQLESILVQVGARECLVPPTLATSSPTDAARVRDVMDRCGVLYSEKSTSTFNARELEGDLAKLVTGSNIERYRPVLDRSGTHAPLAALISFLDLLGDVAARQRYTLYLYDPGRYMRLDVEAQRALHVTKNNRDHGTTAGGSTGSGSDCFSLTSLLSRQRTPMGKRTLRLWLKQPLMDLEEIARRHDVVEALVDDLDLRGQLRDVQLRGLPDVERLVRKLDRKKTTLMDLCQLYRVAARLPVLAQLLDDHAGPHASVLRSRFVDPLRQAHDADHLQRFEQLLEAAVDLDRVPDEYAICPHYSPELGEIAAEKAAVEANVEAAAAGAAEDLRLTLGTNVKLEWHKFSNQRVRCLRITAKEEKACRKRLAGGDYTVLETRKDGTKFTSRKLKKAAEALQSLESDYAQRQKHLVDQVVGVAATFAPVWESVVQVLADIDVLCGLADLAATAPVPYVRPDMRPSDDGELRLIGCRHPCVEAQDGVAFIKNDCVMEKGKSWFQVITGPNMGGKSTFIRQVGVCVVLAQIGSFVPCDAARIPLRDAVFARVGAGDSQLRGVSTFMAEMLETASILKGATSHSLIIIDELGRGTSTYDGFGLAWAISEHLMQHVGAPTLFATHFHELTALQGDVGVANRHVATRIDPANQQLSMLYQLRDGHCDQSFGIHVAELACFPPEVVACARAKAKELEDFSTIGGGGSGGGGGGCGEDVVVKKRDRSEEDGVATDGDETPAMRIARTKRRLVSFLQEFASLPLDSLEPGEAMEASRRLVAQLEEEGRHDAGVAALIQASNLETV